MATGYWISRNLKASSGAEPVRSSEVARRVAAGEIHDFISAGAPTKGSVIAALAEMQSRLRQIVGQVRASSDSIATGSSEIDTGNQDLSQRTELQASALRQTAATMEQLRTSVHSNNKRAVHANRLAQDASAVAAEGGEVVSRVVSTMQDISHSSRKIGDIIGVIDGFAFQTNTLALNAAVEAARAGE